MSRIHERRNIESMRLENLCFSDLEGIYQVEDVNLEFQPQTIYLLKGEVSICTEFLKILAAVKTPTRGEYWINGEPVHEMSFDDFLPYRMSMGLTFALGGVLSNRTLRENMMLPFLYHEAGYKTSEQTVNHMLATLGLEKYQNQRPASVPGYVRKLTSIGRALALEPQVLLLDDPVSSLNAPTIQKIKLWMYERLQSKKLMYVFVASEDAAVVEGLEHQVIELWDRRSVGHLKRTEAV